MGILGHFFPYIFYLFKMKALIDKLEAYTYNKSTVWFLSTPIQ